LTPSRDQLLALLATGPRSPRKLLEELGLGRDQTGRLRAALQELLREGAVERVGGRYGVPSRRSYVEGVFRAVRRPVREPRHGGRGGRRGRRDGAVAGHVEGGDGSIQAVAEARGARDGDRVLLRLDGRRPEIEAVVAPKPEHVVGVLRMDRRGPWVWPWRERSRLRFAVSRLPDDAEDGDVVVLEPGGRRPRDGGGGRGRRGRGGDGPEARGRVVEVLGPPGSPEADFRAVVWRHRLPVEFPREVLAAADAIDPGLGRAERRARTDLTELPFLTIDPATARDHDDAVCVEPGGRRLWVAIADVSRCVPEGSALDREALQRGNSVYFPDRAIPMLPPVLSGDLCSLRPDVERPGVAVALDVGRGGETRLERVERCILRSRARLSYDEAAAVMDPGGAEGAGPRDATVRAQLESLARVAERLMARRFAGGSIDFDLPTAEIVLGDAGHPVDIVESPRTSAHRAIEEAMLAANRAVAERLDRARIPALWRIHEPPLDDELDELAELLRGLGLLEGARTATLGPREIARAVARARGRPEERLVNLMTLRSLRQARYSARRRPHFALAFEHYLHFTSPIRRYADLVVHRALLDLLDGSGLARERAAARAGGLDAVAARISARERLAMEAEREAVGIKKCVFVARHVGEVLPGTVEGVARHGIYVALDGIFVDGLVHASRLPRGLSLAADGMSWVARNGRAAFRLGDRVQVRVLGTDPARGRIDFALADVAASRGRPGQAGSPADAGRSSGRARSPRQPSADRASSSASTSAARRSQSP